MTTKNIKLNSEKHNRRSVRLNGYDYSQNGAYFITICTHNQDCLFGEILDYGEMKLNQCGQIANEFWEILPVRFANVELDVFVIMPNHIHGIIILNNNDVGATLAVALDDGNRARVNRAPTSIGDIVGAYKSLVANACLGVYKSKNEMMGKLWQRNFYEHVIRNEIDLGEIRQYIVNNPANWPTDRNNPTS